jgi:hypothetical protein
LWRLKEKSLEGIFDISDMNLIKVFENYVVIALPVFVKKYNKIEVYDVKSKAKLIVDDTGDFDNLSVFPNPSECKDCLLFGVTSVSGRIKIYQVVLTAEIRTIVRIFSFEDEHFPINRFLWYPACRFSYFLFCLFICIFFFFV